MQEKEFRKLLEKSINNSLNEKEAQILDKFHQDLDTITSLNASNNEEVKQSIWATINKKLRSKAKIKTKRLITSAAAIFVGMLTVGYYITQQNKNIDVEPSNVITLELEDGTLKVLKENAATNLYDETGKIVGKQNKNQLIYTDTEASPKELVYNTLNIPYGKTFELLLSDGTQVHLNAGSSLKYPVQFLYGMERKVFVTGEIFLDVAKDAKHPFIVSAGNLNVKVFGTQFNVNAYPEDEVAEVVLVEGSVGLYTEGYEVSETLKPGFKASFNKQNQVIAKSKVPTGIYTSWMNGELVFRNMPFTNILKKLERYYDVTIINNNSELSDDRFNASFGSNPVIEEVLEELKITYNLDYKIEEDTITIN